MKFAYRTRDNATPIGRQRIYVSYHEDDVAARDDVISQLLEVDIARDCAIWYDTECEAAYIKDDLYESLQCMSLIVFVVTNNMLGKPSRALSTVLRFSAGHSIPVLPILCHGCDYGEFTAKFNDIPCAMQDDENYEQDLNSRISVLLGSAELHETLSNRFRSGNIYICSDPEDRLLIRRVSNVVSGIEILRNFSITHDALFSAYESDEAEQQRLIDNSDLVLVVATPHLFRKGSRIIDFVLPYVQRKGKPVLAIEIGDLRSQRLLKLDKYFPEIIHITETQLLREYIGKAVGSKVRPNNAPSHIYQLGLAHLFAIDVVPNYKLATELFVSAANSGLLEAQKQLVFMFRSGVGLHGDYASGVTWQKRVIERLTRTYNADTSLENATELADAINLLGWLYRLLEQPDKAENAYSNCISLCQMRLRSASSAPLLDQYATACEIIGKLREAKFDLKGAEERYRTALDCRERSQQERYSQETLSSIGDLQLALGDICMARGHLEDADAFYRRCYERRESDVDRCPSNFFRRRLAVILERLATLYDRCGDRERAAECIRGSVDIYRTIVTETDSITPRRDLAHAISMLYAHLVEAERFDEAEREILSAINIRHRLSGEVKSDDGGAIEISRELIADNDMLGDIRKLTGKIDHARDAYMRALDTRIALAKDNPGDIKLQEAIADRCAAIAALDPSHDKSRELLVKAVEVWEQLFAQTGQSRYDENAQRIQAQFAPKRIFAERIIPKKH